ncbi:DHH family phosphoesterase [Geopsychrobacter electrodiphilus]|uniref:DHH family phosphoesterase n=1 Tax=Geopsychrobacter electrodiphilus TaxID=225196 RepID=UPI00036740A1|nr:bifunctional oligoribonuclease/PAP phosphatase NrnA [Geopsychrobacter electrodiphilus]
MITEIIKQIDGGQRFLVCAHSSPDGDAIGSTLGLMLGLEKLGKEVVAYNADGVPDTLRFLPGADRLVTDLSDQPAFDCVFVLDAGDLKRTIDPVAERAPVLVNIDHHPGSTFGTICYLDVTAAATAVMIYRLFKACNLTLDTDIALALYTGLLSDTGSFRYSNSNAEAFAVGGELVAFGINPWDVASALYESQPPERMKLLSLVLATLHISTDHKYASVAMSLDMLQEAGALPEHSESFVNYPRAISGVEVAVFFRQVDPTKVKLSFRSRGRIDVSCLANQLGGGGHKNAAGGEMSGSLESVVPQVHSLLETLLN